MNAVERDKLLSRARSCRMVMENQKLTLDTLYLASQQLWADDNFRERCDSLLREVAREAVKTARVWADLGRGDPAKDASDAHSGSGDQADDSPF